jgi:hypothetical protein
MVAFAILAVGLAYMTVAQNQCLDRGVRALNLRDMRVMADTVFRRMVYEYWRWNDGDSGTADQWYAEFAGLRGASKDRWRIYRLVLRKRKGVVAGADPSGRLDSLFEEEDFYDRDTSGTSTGSTGTGSDATTAAAAGESAYRLELEVYLEGRDEPEMVLRSIVPEPE